MSRRDYRLVADSLRELKKSSSFTKDEDKIISCLVTIFRKDNPRFDEQKFWDYIER